MELYVLQFFGGLSILWRYTFNSSHYSSLFLNFLDHSEKNMNLNFRFQI